MKNKAIKTIDLFAGCGGLLDGFEQDGHYETMAAVEWDAAACTTLTRRLRDKWKYKNAADIAVRFDLQRSEELFCGWRDDPDFGSGFGLDMLVGGRAVDLVVGGPPCQAYSIAGRIRDANSMRDDYRNFLFESYARVISRYKPKAFIFENVPGLLSARPQGRYISELIAEKFDELGYLIAPDLKSALVNMADYGVPQNRKRLIILGLSKETYGIRAKLLLDSFYSEILPTFKVKKRVSVLQAIGDLPKLYPLPAAERAAGRKLSHSESRVPVANHCPRFHNDRDVSIFRMLAEDIESGACRYCSTESLKALYTQMTGHVSAIHKYHVLRADQPSNLIPAHLFKDGLRHIHPDSAQARSITVREAARLQGFADDFVFYGSAGDQYKMIGNAVPPAFSKILARAVRQLLFS